jgi:hypothetical protein
MDGQIGASAEESKMRVRAIAMILPPLLLAACGSREEAPSPEPTHAGPRPGEAAMPDGGLPPFGERESLQRESGSWMQRLEPDATAFCTFTERPPSERPAGLVATAWSGNMDLLTEGYVLGQDPSAPFVEALWMKDKPVIAARAGMDDLWIEPAGDDWGQVLLAIDAQRFTCTLLPKPD